MDAITKIRPLNAEALAASRADLSRLLMLCVDAGASVGFMAPLSPADADAYWRDVADGVSHGSRVLLTADLPGEVVGAVQLVLAQQANQPHRAEVSKLLVTPACRGRGIGALLMRAVEAEAARLGRTVLVLDTATAEAERLYTREGWQRVGEVPNYALLPDGRPCATVFFHKQLA